ncbi:MAG TPA: slipin family protein [Bryobacteraceae bacterium]|jgi:regulator of protease activity HflC (stomatin/prohibitin superfamily)|nr:slipin family protein [Bryobacteraceae bacterium]
MLWKRIVVGDQERVLVAKNGRFDAILTPGAYRVFAAPGVSLEVEKFNVRDLVFHSAWTDYLVKERPEVVERHFMLVETNDVQVAMVYADGKLYKVLTPAKRVLFWRGPVEVTAEVVDVVAEPAIPLDKLTALERLGREASVTFSLVEEGKTGLLFLDNRLVRTLPPGKYGFWAVTGGPRVEIVDLRRQTLEVPGQEILSRDKVSLRVNIVAEYQVVDAAKARQTITNFEAYFYRLLQLTVRQALGKKTLEEILAEKTEVDASTASVVRGEMEALGVQVGAIALKDIILPGDMREIMNQVVSAEKQAQANLIRRREETAATRSLLNTAKLLEDNPILVRLKELETLEKVVEKVERLTVMSGFEGLLDNLIHLKAPAGK